jgi:hypothetical protein
MSDLPYTPDEDPQLPLEDHEMPTRRIQPVDEEMLAETQVSASMPPELPQEAPHEATEPDYRDIPHMLRAMAALEAEDPETEQYPGMEDSLSDFYEAVAPDQGSEAMEDTVATNPVDSPPPVMRVPSNDMPPTRTYTDELPHAVPSSPMPPPVYGGFDDREPQIRKKQRRTARERRDSGLYLPWWSLLILLAVVAFFAALLIMALNALGGKFTPGGETPVIIVVTSTSTPLPTEAQVVIPPTAPLSFLTATPFTAPTEPGAGLLPTETPRPSVITPAPESLEIGIGKVVEVFDVEGAGLNVREGPGTGFVVLFIAPNEARYEVIDGPVPAGEFSWWKIRDPNTLVEGWAVEDYVRVPQP